MSRRVTEYIESPLNYIGGKGRILNDLLPLFPNGIDTFVDLFAGGCNVGINVHADNVIYNDIDSRLIGIFRMFKRIKTENIISRIDDLIDYYGFSKTSLHNFAYYGGNSMKGVSVYNRQRFIRLRNDFNNLIRRNTQYYIMLYTLIVFGFNNQIRFNDKGDYNLPVGKRDFNNVIREKLSVFVNALKDQQCMFQSHDFRRFDTHNLTPNSFVYVDPPYLLTNATYNEKDGWTEADEADLLTFLDDLNNRHIRFALSNVLTHKGRRNLQLINWLAHHNFHVIHVANDYSNSNYQVKGKNSQSDEVIILNY